MCFSDPYRDTQKFLRSKISHIINGLEIEQFLLKWAAACEPWNFSSGTFSWRNSISMMCFRPEAMNTLHDVKAILIFVKDYLFIVSLQTPFFLLKIHKCTSISRLKIIALTLMIHGYYSVWVTDHSAWQNSHDLMTNNRILIGKMAPWVYSFLKV